MICFWSLTRATQDPEAERSLRFDLSESFCSLAELYLTDLCFNDDAEQQCESAVTSACTVCPENPTGFQLQASLRLSQSRLDDAKVSLATSVKLWSTCPEPFYPSFDSRTRTASLLMECGMNCEATSCLEALVQEDDAHPECWYLLARCHATLEAPESAVECLEMATQLFRTEAGSAGEAMDGVDDGGDGADEETLQGQVAELLAEQTAILEKSGAAGEEGVAPS